MRIIAGAFRGTRLAALGKGDSAAHLRPTPDRVRESLFSVLGARIDWDGCRVLDLFAGTGALGLEALSRGAATAIFVENGRTGQRLLAENIAKLRVADRARVIRGDATRLGPAPGPSDLVFLDPPYASRLADPIASGLLDRNALSPFGVLCIETQAKDHASPPPGFTLLDMRQYGAAQLMLLRIAG